jgi:2-amino-4-hydroxy-6-hydroxymethyldihydropteridine diphosphokinase
MSQIYLCLSSNLGDRLQNLKQAIQSLQNNQIQVINSSNIYETEPWGLTEQPWFLNQCIQISTNLNPHQLLNIINQIESDLGRIRHQKWAERTIDIDILYYQDQIIQTEKLTIPHSEIKNRQFVLQPLAEIAPNFIDPLDNKTIKELQSNCSDTSKIKLYES